jgi:hypothetical protein
MAHKIELNLNILILYISKDMLYTFTISGIYFEISIFVRIGAPYSENHPKKETQRENGG